jgi:hypothetical protein
MVVYPVEEIVEAAQVVETALNKHNIKHLFTGYRWVSSVILWRT